jgi:hypothetical protein
MQPHSTSVGTPAHVPGPYEQDIFHWDGGFFALLCLASWVAFFWLWAWNHKAPQPPAPKKRRESEAWELPENWRN